MCQKRRNLQRKGISSLSMKGGRKMNARSATPHAGPRACLRPPRRKPRASGRRSGSVPRSPRREEMAAAPAAPAAAAVAAAASEGDVACPPCGNNLLIIGDGPENEAEEPPACPSPTHAVVAEGASAPDDSSTGSSALGQDWQIEDPVDCGDAKCWRCNQLVRADVASLEEHSKVCRRLSAGAELESGQDPAAQDLAALSALVQAQPEGGADGSSGSAYRPITYLRLSSAQVGGQLSGTLASVTTRAYGARAQVGDQLSGTLESVKSKAFSYFGAGHPYKLPEDGIVSFRSVHSSKHLTVLDGAPETKSYSSSAVTEESQWLIMKTSTPGVVTIKSLLTGWFLRVGGKDVVDEQTVHLAGGDKTELYEWRLVKEEEGAASVRSVFNNLQLAVDADGGARVVAEAAATDGKAEKRSQWRVVSLLEPDPRSGGIAELTPELDPLQLYARVEATVERLTVLMMDPVLNGIPKLGIAPVRCQAQEYIAKHGSGKVAIDALRAEMAEDDGRAVGMPRMVLSKLSELLVLRFLPFVGAGAYLSQVLFSRLRLAAMVAELYGHDTADSEVQGMLLFCILPSVSGDGEQGAAEQPTDFPAAGSPGAGSVANAALIRASKGLAHGLAKQAVKRATGYRTAADVYDLCSAILSEQLGRRAGADDSSSSAAAAPPESAEHATLERAILVFRPSLAKKLKPASIGLLAVGAALPAVASIFRKLAGLAAKAAPWLRVPESYILFVLVTLVLTVGALVARQLPDAAADHPEIFSSVVLVGHAALPLIAAFDATGMLISSLQRSPMGIDRDRGCGALLFLLGVWAWLRTWQRLQANPGTEAAQGVPTPAQRALLGTVAALGSLDLFGPDGLGLHPCPPFGALRSHHWMFGMLQAVALECQLRLLLVLRNGEVLLRLLGATRTMGLAIALFLGGLTASVGFLVSNREFSKFVDSIAPPPRVAAVVVMLRHNCAVNALALGAGAGLLWEFPADGSLPTVVAGFARLLGVALGAGAVGLVALFFEENREELLDPCGGRWLLVLPESSQKARLQAVKVWSKLRLGATGAVVEKGTAFVGRRMIQSAVEYGASWWSSPLERTAAVAVEAAAAAVGGGGTGAAASAVGAAI
mmetsp:Transcript_93291/g.301775  ORF Transcript_93291/g.301775 Transcript_93291/m.301775 type:complete len:1110 (-) Transcript_93291:103-3432(-)